MVLPDFIKYKYLYSCKIFGGIICLLTSEHLISTKCVPGTGRTKGKQGITTLSSLINIYWVY